MGARVELAPVDPSGGSNQLAAPAQLSPNSRIRRFGQVCGRDCARINAIEAVDRGDTGMAVYWEVGIRSRLGQQVSAEGQDVRNVLRLRGASIRIGVIGNIVEPKFQIRMLAKSAKCFGHRPVRD